MYSTQIEQAACTEPYQPQQAAISNVARSDLNGLFSVVNTNIVHTIQFHIKRISIPAR